MQIIAYIERSKFTRLEENSKKECINILSLSSVNSGSDILFQESRIFICTHKTSLVWYYCVSTFEAKDHELIVQYALFNNLIKLNYTFWSAWNTRVT